MKNKNNNTILSFLVLWISCSASILLLIFRKTAVLPAVVLVLLSGIILFIFRKKINLSYITDIQSSDVYLYVLTFIICFGGLIFCAVRNDFYEPVIRMASHLGIRYKLLRYIFTVSLASASIPFICYAVKYIIKDTMQITPDTFNSNRRWLKVWMILSVIYCIAIITIIRSNCIYKDDMQRVVCGVTVYTRESRLLAEYVLGLIETNTFFADISPLTKLLEMSLMALAAVIVFKVISEKKHAGFWDYIGMISFGIFPYFMEPISFKYDGPQHALAVVLAVIPILFYKRQSVKYIIITALCIALSCSSHQVPMTLFPMAVILLCVVNLNTGRQDSSQLKKLCINSVCGYAIGLGFYRLFIMRPIEYNTALSTMHSFKNLIPGIYNNYKMFFGNVISDYQPLWLALSLLTIICLYTSLIRNSVLKKSCSALISACAIVIMLALTYSLYPLLEGPKCFPRHMYLFGVFNGMMTIASISFCRQKAIIAKTSATILSMAYISFALLYGNMLSYQSGYTAFRVQSVINDLNELPEFQENESVQVQISGSTGYAPAVYYHSEHYPILSRLVAISFDEAAGTWAATDLYNLYGLNAYYDPKNDKDISNADLTKIKDTYYHNIYTDGERYLVELKERSKVVWLE